MNRGKKLFWPAVLLVALAALVCGQIITSSIVGQITDATGAAVPDADITVTNTGTGITVKMTADSSGAYSVPNLQPGVYEVTASKTGFQTYRTTGVQVLASQSVRVDMKLQVGQVQQTVDVTGQAPWCRRSRPPSGGPSAASRLRNCLSANSPSTR